MLLSCSIPLPVSLTVIKREGPLYVSNEFDDLAFSSRGTERPGLSLRLNGSIEVSAIEVAPRLSFFPIDGDCGTESFGADPLSS